MSGHAIHPPLTGETLTGQLYRAYGGHAVASTRERKSWAFTRG